MTWTRHPLVLLASLAAGALLGALSPAGSDIAAFIGRLFGNLMELAALPLLGVATVFGVRNVVALPQRGRRLAGVLAMAALALLGCGLLGAFAAGGAGLGGHFDAAGLRALGELVQQAGGDAGRDVMRLRPSAAELAAQARGAGGLGAGAAVLAPSLGAGLDALDAGPPEAARGHLDNLFALLIDGRPAALIAAAFVFGLAFASLGRERNRVLAGQLEAVYRACERLIALALHLLPLLTFGLAAQIAATADARTVGLLGGPLLVLLAAGLPVGAVALAVICRAAGCTPWQALDALKAPLFVSLVAPSPVAAIPATIEALGARLGFARGLTELLVPAGAVLLRAGTALHTAAIVVFVATLYGEAPAPLMLAWIGLLAAVASVVAGPGQPFGALGAAALVLGWLHLPAEGLLPLLLLTDRICSGLRQMLGLFCLSGIVAHANLGLPAERRAFVPGAPSAPLGLVVTRRGLALALACVALAGVLSFVVGVGIGLRFAA
ncbi:cation:dicarboxylate symporter family transporter [Derxia gummosa]|uniref:Cation:dicarboxylate symporter family transporter n=1 Tax=Derxia gummosa DSM 723 TaxID=1121388 RepID=A0A8B6X5A6_9BURK|nr:cation:dicarboxylase symporter family transporter [Derxia gummosa]